MKKLMNFTVRKKISNCGRTNIQFYLIVLFISLLPLTAQEVSFDFNEQLRAFQESRNNINSAGMLVLGSWAVGNILLGTYGNFSANGEAKYFHQFNAIWNSVNLGIAVFGYLNAQSSDPSSMTNFQILDEYNSLQSFLLLNAGLDLAYIAVGAYLKERAKISSSSNRLRGYGNSLFLQGGFLLLFDITLYFIHQNNASVNLYPYLESFMKNGVGLTLNISL